MSTATKYAIRINRISVVALCVLIGAITLFSLIVPYKSNKDLQQAFLPIALAAVSAAISIGGAISAANKKKKLAEQMEKMKLEKPQGLINAENTLSALASQGLPGKDLMQDALKEPLAQSLTNMRELGASPVTVAGMASTGMSQVTDNIRQLLVSDAQAKMGNMVNLANFQAGPMAQFDLQQQEFNINKTLGAEYARMEGTAALYQGISNAVGTVGSAVGNQQYLNYLKSLNANQGSMINSWDNAMNQDQFKAAQFQWNLATSMNPALAGNAGGNAGMPGSTYMSPNFGFDAGKSIAMPDPLAFPSTVQSGFNLGAYGAPMRTAALYPAMQAPVLGGQQQGFNYGFSNTVQSGFSPSMRTPWSPPDFQYIGGPFNR